MQGAGLSEEGRGERFFQALARLERLVTQACEAEPGEPWPSRVAAAIHATLAHAAANSEDAFVLTTEALAAGREGFRLYDRMIVSFGNRLLEGREGCPWGADLPEVTEKAMVGGVATLIAQRVDSGRAAELPALTPEAVQFVLTPYLGSDEACRVAVEET